MDMRPFGRTGMHLSVLGFGCGAVGGLMVRGAPADQERAIARAIDAGVNYFDTAWQYGEGESEKNLGRILQTLKPANAVVGTKVRLQSDDFARIGDAVTRSLEASLARLRLDRVDILHLHNAITASGGGNAYSVAQVLGEAVPAMERLRSPLSCLNSSCRAFSNLRSISPATAASRFSRSLLVTRSSSTFFCSAASFSSWLGRRPNASLAWL